MMNITLTGVLTEDCEKRTDKKGHEYIRFKLACKDVDNTVNPTATEIRCFSHNIQYASMKKGDYIFVIGALKISTFNEKKMNLDVYVSQIARGVIVNEQK